MDVRRDGYFGLLLFNGKRLSTGQSPKGSIMGLVSESLKSIAAEKARLTADGDFEIVLRVRNKPFDTSAEGVLNLGKAEELAALIDNGHEGDKPFENESYEDFYQRLLDQDYPRASAEFIAAQWFDREVSPTTTLWLNDPRALRFRVLNSRDEDYEAALPSEYESLKHYVQTTYPEFVEGLVFRTA